MTIQALLCVSCLVLLVFLTLFFNFHVNHVNDCLYCIICVVCYKVVELSSRHGAKLKHVFLTFFSSVFLQKISKLGLRTKNVLWK